MRPCLSLQRPASSVKPDGMLMAARLRAEMRPIDDALLDAVIVQARASARRRHMHLLHGDYADPVQRMLNALEPDSYVPPHRHFEADRVEVFMALRGRLGVLEFDGTGAVHCALVLDPRGPARGVEIPMGAWHTIVALEPGTVAYEVKGGPFDPARAKEPAPWAPPEGDPRAPASLARLRQAALAAAAPAS